MTLLTYAVLTDVPTNVVATLLDIAKCLDTSLPDRRHQLSPIDLALTLQRPQELMTVLTSHSTTSTTAAADLKA